MEPGIFFALFASILWGSMFSLSKNIKANQIFQNIYITIGGFIVALIVFFFNNLAITQTSVISGLVSGTLWALGSLSFLYAMSYIGIGRAFPLSVSGQILVSLFSGTILFGELISKGILNFIIALAGVLLICLSAFIIGKTKENVANKDYYKGIIFTALSSLFWGSQFIPVKFSGSDAYTIMLPFTIGMLLTSATIAILKYRNNLEFFYHGNILNLLNGAMWAIGNYLSLLAIESIGFAKGFILSQTGVVIVPALIGSFFFKEINSGKNRLLVAIALILILAGSAIISSVK